MKVTLKQAHTHAGVDYPAGAEIDVCEADAKWLAEQDVIEQPVAVVKASTSKKD